MIPIRNIYYMLSYAYKVLRDAGYKDLAFEDFHNAADLCAAILVRGVSSLLKRGLAKEYLQEEDSLSMPRGKIEISASIKTQSLQKRQLVCSYDDFSVNTSMNRILKSTMRLLLAADIDPFRKKALRKLLVYFGDVNGTDLSAVQWKMRFDRNNQTYRMLMGICELICKGLLQRSEDGSMRLMDFVDEQRMCRLYEKFILEYYRQEHPEIIARAAQIPWQLDDDEDAFLPVMQTDVYLSDPSETNVLIIDAKYYAHTMQTQFDVSTLHSANLYQIFTYVKNAEKALSYQPHTVSGMLLYAKTDEEFVPHHTYTMSGNRIMVDSLDLSKEFDGIREQLDGIAARFTT